MGRLAEKKGVTYLIEAMKQVDAMLIIVGAGPLEAQLKEQAKEQGDKIIFLGSKTHEELETIYASADIFAAPSVTAKDGDQEGFGLVILEAMASGMAVVANDSGGIRDLITHGKNGLLAVEKDVDSLAEKLNFFVNNEAERQRCMKEAVMSAKQYDYKKIAERYAEILNKQIKER